MSWLGRLSLHVGGLLLAFFPTPARAVGGNSGFFSVGQVWAASTGETYVYGSGILNPDSCVTTSFIVIAANNTNKDTFVSVLLTAKATGRRVNFWMIGCVSTSLSSSAPLAAIIEME